MDELGKALTDVTEQYVRPIKLIHQTLQTHHQQNRKLRSWIAHIRAISP